MRSPWQLFKGFASRRKSDETVASVDEAVPRPDPQVDLFERINARQRELEALPKSTADENKTDRQPASIVADAQLPLPAVQTNPVPSQLADHVAPEGNNRPAPIGPAVKTIDGKKGADALTTRSNSRRANGTQPRENLGKRPVVTVAMEQPVAVKQTAVDEAAELDLAITNLRLQLSSKLLEQNTQLRRMIERYGDS